MRTAIGSIIVLLVCLLSQAQIVGCPIQPTQVKNTDSQIAIAFQNASGKGIASYRFRLTLYDVWGQSHSFPQSLRGNVRLAANVRRTAIWQTRMAMQFLSPSVQASVEQTTFVDGTVWFDDGSRACSVTSTQE
jgi:hypothetical protein